MISVSEKDTKYYSSQPTVPFCPDIAVECHTGKTTYMIETYFSHSSGIQNSNIEEASSSFMVGTILGT